MASQAGTPDDMWAFTTRNASLDFRAATMFAAASRALEGYNDDLAQRALKQSKRLLEEATEIMNSRQQTANRRGGNSGGMATNLQLYGATHEKKYLDLFKQQIWTSLDKNLNANVQTALDAIPGNVAPGVLFRKPDHFEDFDDWPFLWGQNEGTIAGNTQYIIFGSAFKNQVKSAK